MTGQQFSKRLKNVSDSLRNGQLLRRQYLTETLKNYQSDNYSCWFAELDK